jgi:hypothetical protein
MDTDFLDWALADFSGYVAADEVYDGPCCILSAVDNRHDKRLPDSTEFSGAAVQARTDSHLR